MGKSNKKSASKVAAATVVAPAPVVAPIAPVPVVAPAPTPTKPLKKGKRGAENIVVKEVASAKKQKVDAKNSKIKVEKKVSNGNEAQIKEVVQVEKVSSEVVTKVGESLKKDAPKIPAPVVAEAAAEIKDDSMPDAVQESESEDDSEDELIPDEEAVPDKNAPEAVPDKDDDSSDEEDSDEEIPEDVKEAESSEEESEDDEAQIKVSEAETKVSEAPPTAASKEKSGSEEDSEEDSDEESEEGSEEEDSALQTQMKVSEAPEPSTASKEESGSEEESEEGSEEESEEGSDEEDNAPQTLTKVSEAPPTTASKEERGSEEESEEGSEEESEEGSEEEDNAPQTQMNVSEDPQPTTASKEESGSEEESEDGSEEESEEGSEEEGNAPQTPNKIDTDIEMTDASAANKTEKTPNTPVTPKEQATGSKTLIVGNLPFSILKADVENFFKSAGEVVDVRFSVFGHVEFASAKQAEKAIEELNGQELLGCGLRLERAKERPAKGEHTPLGGDGQSSQRPLNVKPNTTGTPEEQATVFLGNLPLSVQEADVKKFLKPAGEVGEVRFSMRGDGSFREYGHAVFATAEQAAKAVEELNGHELLGRQLRVGFAHLKRAKGDKTPRGGPTKVEGDGATKQVLELNGSDLGSNNSTVKEARPRGDGGRGRGRGRGRGIRFGSGRGRRRNSGTR